MWLLVWGRFIEFRLHICGNTPQVYQRPLSGPNSTPTSRLSSPFQGLIQHQPQTVLTNPRAAYSDQSQPTHQPSRPDKRRVPARVSVETYIQKVLYSASTINASATHSGIAAMHPSTLFVVRLTSQGSALP
jgi:hypothetical protein